MLHVSEAKVWQFTGDSLLEVVVSCLVVLSGLKLEIKDQWSLC
jgi:hypothetical protein